MVIGVHVSGVREQCQSVGCPPSSRLDSTFDKLLCQRISPYYRLRLRPERDAQVCVDLSDLGGVDLDMERHLMSKDR